MPRKTERGAKQLLTSTAVRTAPFALLHFGRLDAVQLREALVQVRLPFHGNPALIRPFRISGVNFINDVHPLDNGPKRGEALSIERRVIVQVDKKLSRARIRSRGCEDESTALVALLDRIVLDVGILPDLVEGWAGVQAKLDDERARSNNHAEEGGVR